MFSPPCSFRYNHLVRLLIIAGPAHTPLDQAREIRNQSTGQTALTIAEILQAAGHNLVLWLGRGATHPLPPSLTVAARFHTLADLQELLAQVELSTFDAILLPAALPDYDFVQAHGPQGESLSPQKWPGSLSRIQVELRPSFRVLPSLRPRAPHAKIVGWKWEAGTTLDQAQKNARQPCFTGHADATVLNGPSLGLGYLLLSARGEARSCADANELGQALLQFLAK